MIYCYIVVNKKAGAMGMLGCSFLAILSNSIVIEMCEDNLLIQYCF